MAPKRVRIRNAAGTAGGAGRPIPPRPFLRTLCSAGLRLFALCRSTCRQQQLPCSPQAQCVIGSPPCCSCSSLELCWRRILVSEVHYMSRLGRHMPHARWSRGHLAAAAAAAAAAGVPAAAACAAGKPLSCHPILHAAASAASQNMSHACYTNPSAAACASYARPDAGARGGATAAAAAAAASAVAAGGACRPTFLCRPFPALPSRLAG